MAEEREELTLVARKSGFDLPTACPSSLPAYIYLRLARIPFRLDFNLIHPDSDQIPYVESGTYVAYNNEKGGVIDSLKEDGIVDLDSEVHSIPEWISTHAMVTSWLADAMMYELWVACDGSSADKVYYSDLPWPIGKFLYFKKVRFTKQLLGITEDNADQREKEIYRRAIIAYEALSTRLGRQSFLFENRPTSLDAVFLGHALFTLQVLPETSVLQCKLLRHPNLIRYTYILKKEFIDAGSSSSIPPFPAYAGSSPSIPPFPADTMFPKREGSKPKSKPKKEKTEEEKKFKRRAKYFLVTQLVAVLVFMSLLGGSDDAGVELDEDDDGSEYHD